MPCRSARSRATPARVASGEAPWRDASCHGRRATPPRWRIYTFLAAIVREASGLAASAQRFPAERGGTRSGPAAIEMVRHLERLSPRDPLTETHYHPVNGGRSCVLRVGSTPDLPRLVPRVPRPWPQV